MTKLISLLQQLIKCKSVTPDDDGAIEILSSKLTALGFRCEHFDFEGDGSYKVKNLYARYGTQSPNLCFAGHTDVVPVGSSQDWTHDPFAAEIYEDIIYGRGVVDMKGAIAAMVDAAAQFIETKQFQGSISFLITGDEEAHSINGTKKLLGALMEKGENLDFCIVGEPTSVKMVGDTIKSGRRGSMNYSLKVIGIQGHVAYPQNADNPLTRLLQILTALKEATLDIGNQNFEPSNLEITSIDVGNSVYNVIPAYATAKFNIRFNDLHTSKQLIEWVTSVCEKFSHNQYELTYLVSGEAFVNNNHFFIEILQQAITKVIGAPASLSTGGGTSDARFIKDYCPVLEIGLLNKTAHQINEHASMIDIMTLRDIYYEFLSHFWQNYNNNILAK